MDKEKVKAGVKKALPYMIVSATQVPFMFDSGGWFNALVCVTNAGLAYYNFKSGKLEYSGKAITDLPEYKEYLDLYKEFTDDIASLYKELGMDNGLDIVMSYKQCLDNGIFSVTGEHKYMLYEKDPDLFINLFGGRVTTGECCCRHNAALLSDIMTSMGKLSPKVSVFEAAKAQKKLILKSKHLVSGVIHKGKRLLVDPTVDCINMYHRGFVYYKGDKALFRDVCVNNDDRKYTLVSDGYDNGALFSDDYEQFLKFNPIVDADELVDDYMNSSKQAAMYMRDFRCFHEEEKPKILELSRLNRIVAPHGRKITEKD